MHLFKFLDDLAFAMPLALLAAGITGDRMARKALNPLDDMARRSSMIDTVLTIAQAESGEIKLKHTKFSLASLVHETVAIVGVLAEEKTQTIVLDGDPEVPGADPSVSSRRMAPAKRDGSPRADVLDYCDRLLWGASPKSSQVVPCC